MRRQRSGEARTTTTTDRAVPDSELRVGANIRRDALAALQTWLPFSSETIRLVVANGFPTARGGGLAGRPSVDAAGLDGVYLAGDWVGDKYLLVDAAASSAQAAARRALSHVPEAVGVAVR